jgi:hypothetical protein
MLMSLIIFLENANTYQSQLLKAVVFPCPNEYVAQFVQPKDTNSPKKAPKTTSHTRKPPSENDTESLLFRPGHEQV